MNYLVIEGYKDAAEKFAAESGLPPTIDLAHIEERMNIRNAVQSGNVEEAIERVNDLDPDVSQSGVRVEGRFSATTLAGLWCQTPTPTPTEG